MSKQCCEECSKNKFALKGKNKKFFGGVCGLTCECHKEQKKCEPDGILYSSIPPQRKCKICGKYWYSEDPVPNCSNHTESTSECEHGNKGNCLACYMQTISSPTKPDTEDMLELIKSIMYADNVDWELSLEDQSITYSKSYQLHARIAEVLRQEKEKAYSKGIKFGMSDANEMAKANHELGRQSAYREIMEMLEKAEGYDSDEYGGEVILKEEQLALLKSKLSQK